MTTEQRADLLEQTDQELREIEAEISRLLIRKRLLLLLRQYLTDTAAA